MLKRKNKSNYYYDAFPVLAHFSVVCAEMVLDYLRNFDPELALEVKEKVHKVEHEADTLKHQVTEKLMVEFMTPIDREDIQVLLHAIDNVTDAIEEISMKLYLYDYEELPPNTVEFMELTIECIRKMEECLKQFPNYLNKDIFEPYIMEVVELEVAGDREYEKNIRLLYTTEKDGFKRHKAEAMYTMIEDVSDRCTYVCRCVQNIALKNL